MKTFPLEPIEKASRDELQALQLTRMKASLRHAYDKVPHYRQKFEAAGVHPDDLQSLADLAKFPFTTKADLRDTYPFGMFAVPMDQIVRIHASSGTTGRRTVPLGDAGGSRSVEGGTRRGPPQRAATCRAATKRRPGTAAAERGARER